MDVQLYALISLEVMQALDMDAGTGGLLASLTLLVSAAGGVLFGVLADRIGRTRALMLSILVYSIFTGACGLAQNVVQLAVFRILLGLDMGTEWATGAALVAETWPAEHRAKAMGIMQSAWAVGYGLAAAVVAVVLPALEWRGVFFIGVLPALVTLWIRRKIPEPEIWVKTKQQEPSPQDAVTTWPIFKPPYLRPALIATLMNAGTMIAWWKLSTWVPSCLKPPVEQGRAALSVVGSSVWIIVLTIGHWIGM